MHDPARRQAGGASARASTGSISSGPTRSRAALAPLVDAGAEPESAVPASCRLVDVLGLGRTGSGTRSRRVGGQHGAAPTPSLGLGRTARSRVDLGADGPHALIAGTTGSGKSELLQTLVAGLAANHPPDEIAFLLIDYKGGAAFAECARLPHTAGVVTDLDPHLTARALRVAQRASCAGASGCSPPPASPTSTAYRRAPGASRSPGW